MHIYLKNIPAKFPLDAIWNDGDLGFLKQVAPNKKNNTKMSSNMRSTQTSIPLGVVSRVQVCLAVFTLWDDLFRRAMSFKLLPFLTSKVLGSDQRSEFNRRQNW